MEKKLSVSSAEKHEHNPFLGEDLFKIDKGRKQIIVGGTKDVLVDSETGETKGMAFMHRIKTVDKAQFVKLYVSEIQSLFDLSRTGLKVFGFVINSLRINGDTIYINHRKVMEYCEYKSTRPVYKGLAELLNNNIIAMSKDANMWYINPSIVFNGDRIAFIKEYRLKDKEVTHGKQLEITDSSNVK